MGGNKAALLTVLNRFRVLQIPIRAFECFVAITKENDSCRRAVIQRSRSSWIVTSRTWRGTQTRSVALLQYTTSNSNNCWYVRFLPMLLFYLFSRFNNEYQNRYRPLLDIVEGHLRQRNPRRDDAVTQTTTSIWIWKSASLELVHNCMRR